MSNFLDKVQKFANDLRLEGKYREASVLYPIITDLALYEEKEYLLTQFKKSYTKMKTLSSNLEKIKMYRLAKEIDIIAQDIEKKIIFFNTLDPIQSVLDSYKALHRISSINKKAINEKDIVEEIIDEIDQKELKYNEVLQLIKDKMVGLSEQQENNITYILEKDYNMTLDKLASKKSKKKNKKTPEELCLEKAETLEERVDCIRDDEKALELELYRSFPAGPTMWSGFSYEAIIPYNQSSQLSYWSLANKKEDKLLKRLGSTKKAAIDFNK